MGQIPRRSRRSEEKTPQRIPRRLRRGRLFVLLALISMPKIYAADVFIDPSFESNDKLGTISNPFSSFSAITISSNNRYLLKRGTVLHEEIIVGGVNDVVFDAYGEGANPVIDGDLSRSYGLKIFTTNNLEIKNIKVKNVTVSCFLIMGSSQFLLSNYGCENSKGYGVQVNVGKNQISGTIENGEIYNVLSDGIGAWDIPGGLIIKNNRVNSFGNDGIDVLGSRNQIIESNTVWHSIDNPDEETSRGTTHAGIKAGGNLGKGGGENIVQYNIVYDVKNYGIYNRNAVGNTYLGNICYDNGVNYNFVADEEPSKAKIIENVSYRTPNRIPERLADLGYDVFIPQGLDNVEEYKNQWLGAIVNVRNYARVNNKEDYIKAMAPFGSDTIFNASVEIASPNLKEVKEQ